MPVRPSFHNSFLKLSITIFSKDEVSAQQMNVLEQQLANSTPCILVGMGELNMFCDPASKDDQQSYRHSSSRRELRGGVFVGGKSLQDLGKHVIQGVIQILLGTRSSSFILCRDGLVYSFGQEGLVLAQREVENLVVKFCTLEGEITMLASCTSE